MQIPPFVLNQLKHLVGAADVHTDEASRLIYAYDCSLSRPRPDAVVCFSHTGQIAPVVRLLVQHRIAFVPRGSATNHAGSCAALKGGVILNLARLNKILQIDTQHGFAWVEPGVITGHLQAQLNRLGFFYAPDPASESVCTLGGNLAQNASGARCLKYGGTLEHVLAAQAVLPTGQEIFLDRSRHGPDLLGLLAGSEGTLGIITRLQVKILPQAKHIQTFLVTFPSLQDGVETVSALCARGIIPRCIEAMDQTTLQTVEAFARAGYPTDPGALLILELDGTAQQIKKELPVLQKICRQHHALQLSPADNEAHRQQLWRGRRAAYAAMARLAPNVMVGDGTVPRSELPRALAKVREILTQNRVEAGLLFHAGDGNFHPHLVFDERIRPQTSRLRTVLKQILQVCVDCGGTVSGEHGIGVEKRAVMAYQYDKPTLDLFTRIKQATDPANLANPLKIIPLDYDEKARPQRALPAPVQPLQERLQAFRQSHTPFVITGRQTRCKTGGLPALSSRKLDQIVEIDLTNYMATAQAGVSLRALHQALRKQGVYAALPAGGGSLGGAFASGQFVHFYPHVTGIEALLPDGSYVRYGGKLTKNAAGYNLVRLFAGSQGAFGLVTVLTFKIFVTPVKHPPARPYQKMAPDEWTDALKRALDPDALLKQTEAAA